MFIFPTAVTLFLWQSNELRSLLSTVVRLRRTLCCTDTSNVNRRDAYVVGLSEWNEPTAIILTLNPRSKHVNSSLNHGRRLIRCHEQNYW